MSAIKAEVKEYKVTQRVVVLEIPEDIVAEAEIKGFLMNQTLVRIQDAILAALDREYTERVGDSDDIPF